MTASKISVSWDDLNNEVVEQKLKRQEALQQVRTHYQQRVTAVAAAKGAWWYQTWVYMAMFGLVGGALAWGASEMFTTFVPDRALEVHVLTTREAAIVQMAQSGEITEHEKALQLDALYTQYRDNDYVRILTDGTIQLAAKKQLLEQKWEQFQSTLLMRQLIWHAIIGAFLAIALGVGDNVMSRNWRNAAINGAVAFVLAVVGASVVSLFDNKIYAALGGDAPGVRLTSQMLARSVGWGILGLLLCIAPGVVLRSPKRMAIGVAGGFIGGLLGGMLFDPISVMVGSGWMSRLIAIVAIGMIAGAGTGLIETVAKTGWLKVDKGLIAGKQFILYRNPTFIGSSPQCEIYLFNDQMISGQHAAIHLLGDGFEIENLNGSASTLLNRKPVTRSRIKSGDKIQIGSTRIVFQEKGSVPRFLR